MTSPILVPAHFASLTLAAVLHSSAIATAQQVDQQDRKDAPTRIQSAEVFVRVALLRDELEQVRFVMGRPQNELPEIGVHGAAPREVFFQALTMFRKADRLCFEHTRDRIDEPPLPSDRITPVDVYYVVDAALARIQRIKAALEIEDEPAVIDRDPSKSPTDVLRSIVQANRQLNLLLDKQFSPSDVYQQVTLGVSYASCLLQHFPSATRIPEAPPFIAGKRPADVLTRLIRCFEVIGRIARRSDLQMLELRLDHILVERAAPSDVYDIASLLVSELAFLHSQLAGADPPRKVYYVGRKFPSHVFQRAGILERQLIELDRASERSPSWLTNKLTKD